MCPIMSSIFQCSNVSQPLKENIYLLCSGAPCMRTRTSVSSATTHFTSFNYIEQSVCQYPNYSDAQSGHHLSDIGQSMQMMFALFIYKKTS